MRHCNSANIDIGGSKLCDGGIKGNEVDGGVLPDAAGKVGNEGGKAVMEHGRGPCLPQVRKEVCNQPLVIACDKIVEILLVQAMQAGVVA